MISFIVILSIIGGIIFTIYGENRGANMEVIDGSTTTTTTSTTTMSSVTHPTSTSSTLLSTSSSTTTEELTTETTTTTTFSPTLPPNVTLKSYVTRDEWSADPPRAKINLQLPIYRIIIAHTGGEFCTNESDCMRIVKELQQNSTHLDDIPFNFLIGDDAKIYEGRGFEVQGQHTTNVYATEYNSVGICVAFIGNYRNDALSESQIEVFENFTKYFIDYGIIDENYKIFSQDQLMFNRAPADKLNEIISTRKGFRNCEIKILFVF